MTLLLAWLTAAALAQEPPTCEPLDEVGFRDLLLQLQAGIDQGNLDLSGQVVEAVYAQVPCFRFSPQPRQWSSFLVGEAIVRFAREEPWEPVMAAALQLYPAVDRGVSSRHPLAEWEAPEPQAKGQRVQPEERFLVDGLPAERLPAPGELHLVQRTDGRFWNTLLVGPDAPLPEGWAEDRVLQPPRVITWFGVGAGLGIAAATQTPNFDTEWVQTIEGSDRTTLAVGGSTQAAATFYSPFGIYGRASLWAWSASPGLDAHVAGIWTFRGLMLGVGGGAASVDEFQGPRAGSELAQEVPDATEAHRLFMPRYTLGTAHLRGGDKLRWHLGAMYGGGTAVRRGVFEAHLAPQAQRDGGRWRVSFTAEFTSGTLAEQRRPDNLLVVGSARTGVHLGRVWGEY